ncbi:MAG: hypothetical protein MUO40_00510 [Anaerolineaceae bacterium]|nr:hypothetical protein [Anaerolineaceae bacterium]
MSHIACVIIQLISYKAAGHGFFVILHPVSILLWLRDRAPWLGFAVSRLSEDRGTACLRMARMGRRACIKGGGYGGRHANIGKVVRLI